MQSRVPFPIFSLLTFFSLCYADNQPQPLPIVLVHGIMSDAQAMKPAIKNIKHYLPKAYVKSVKLGGIVNSFFNMRDQLEWLRKEVQSDPKLANGFNMIAHSQGGLVARAFIQQYNTPKVYNYIAWGAPEQGIFGAPGTYDIKFIWLNLLTAFMHTIIYSSGFQKYVSFGNYWKDPLHNELYLAQCTFLPYLNNEISHPNSALYKENLCSLQHMVIVQSTEEDIIDPPQSCHFGYYTTGTAQKITGMFDSEQYKQDLIGLKTLYESGRLLLKWAHCTHTNYQSDIPNFIENTLPYLQPS